jgi:hypothetical protein
MNCKRKKTESNATPFIWQEEEESGLAEQGTWGG